MINDLHVAIDLQMETAMSGTAQAIQHNFSAETIDNLLTINKELDYWSRSRIQENVNRETTNKLDRLILIVRTNLHLLHALQSAMINVG